MYRLFGLRSDRANLVFEASRSGLPNAPEKHGSISFTVRQRHMVDLPESKGTVMDEMSPLTTRFQAETAMGRNPFS